MAAAAETWSPAARGCGIRVLVDEVLMDPKSALSEVLRATPGWQPGAAEAATVSQVSGAMTNLVYRCTTPGPTSENASVIVRVFGSGGKLFSQKDERNIFLLASQLGVGPRCLVEFANGRVEEFLPGENLSSASMRRADVSAAIAAAMAAFHVRMLARLPVAQHASSGDGGAAGAAGALRPAIYDRIRRWHAAAAELCSAELAQVGLTNVPVELAQLEAHLAARFPLWVGFCHNDTQYGNMLLFGSSSSSSSNGHIAEVGAAMNGPAAAASPTASIEVKLIDYEYSTLNDVAFDVANHFCEWAYNYHSDEAHVFHESWLPSEDQQLQFCRAYIAAMQAQQAQQAGGPAEEQDGAAGARLAAAILSAESGRSSGNGSASDAADVAERAARLLLAKAQAHAVLVHLKWGLWGVVQHRMSDCDFDYLGYARQRVQRYHATKQALLAQ
ncbi:hypothetical protein ABPG77_001426 [Micractinium sp. CCAP 211/92]